MDIGSFLKRFRGVKGPSASGEYTAKCPAHDDKTASLSIGVKPGKDGKARIVVCCHAGCTTDSVLAMVGLTYRDLIVEPDPNWTPRVIRGRGKNSGKRGSSRAERSGEGAGDPAGQPHGGADPAQDGAGNGQKTEQKAGNDSERSENGNDGPGLPMTVDPETGEVIYTVGGQQSGAAGSQQGTGNAAKTQQGGNQQNGSKAAGNQQNRQEQQEPQIDWGHPDRVYSYTDGKGVELFQVVRYHYIGAPGKTFRQRRKEPGNPKANRDGFVMSVPAEIRDTTLYRMPTVIRTISEGKPLYLVEGEKDVETLERLGYPATCNPGGAGKWADGYTRALTGADVIILPDNDTEKNDYTGQKHAWNIALQLKDVAKRVRLIDLRECCAELPPKGDISDMVAMMGDTGAMDALARQVAATTDFDSSAVPFWLSPMDQARALYNMVDGYGILDGCIAQKVQDGHKKLTDFVVIPRMELTRDDGVTRSLNFVLDGWNSKGKKLERVTVSGKDLDGMNWVTEKWGFEANLAPGSTVKGKVSWCINKVGQMTAKRVTEYSHTGWRRIGGKWVYLYQGGAVGADGITVNLAAEALKTYRLDGSGAEGFERITCREGAEWSWKMKGAMREDIAVALLGIAYLAPLREWMSQTDITPAFSLFLLGQMQCGKSTAAALAMSHFGNFHTRNAPANFADTSNVIRKKAFLIKDMPLLVDDFHPSSSLQERKRMITVAQDLSRTYGDGAQRGRLNADGTIQASNPPRSVAIISGEDLPDIGASGLARYFVVNVEKGDVIRTDGSGNEALTELQEAARAGYLQKAMRGYILWLSEQTEELPEMMHKMFSDFRKVVQQRGAGSQARAPEAVACIMSGYKMMLKYFRSLGIIDAQTATAELGKALEVLTDMSRQQGKEQESEKPTRIFLNHLEELTSSGRVVLKDLRDIEAKDPPPSVTMGGYMDADYYYLLSNVVFGAVQKLCREQGTEFPVSLKMLYKHLKADGVVEYSEKDEPTKNKWIGGKAVRLMWIPRARMNGPEGNAEQMRMNMVQTGGDELPEEWRK